MTVPLKVTGVEGVPLHAAVNTTNTAIMNWVKSGTHLRRTIPIPLGEISHSSMLSPNTHTPNGLFIAPSKQVIWRMTRGREAHYNLSSNISEMQK
jgi:hypothetical protein